MNNVCIVCGSGLVLSFWRGHPENQKVHCNDCGSEVTAWMHKKKQPNSERSDQRIHVLPVGDVEIHSAQAICWCHPTETEPRLWVHNAKDCREARERATGDKCSDGWINIAEYV